MKEATYALVVVALLAGWVLWTGAVMRECLLDHSWWYCLRAFG